MVYVIYSYGGVRRLVDQVECLGMKFAICYEDQTIPALVEAGRIAAGNHVEFTPPDGSDWAIYLQRRHP